ncbi:oxygenase MpaB family protein (plasmid) [Mesorhizobium sp. AaZ16]|uniref:oxygenase MpaB family protein n=1 Tax=Mesorhizobium sp. AaZ16 TaxID=3402289 RepID=UPI00374E20BE
MGAIILPRLVQSRIETIASDFLTPKGMLAIDFSRPPGEAALIYPGSVSWRIFKNPIALFVGGITAVLLELAEPRVRAGVCKHTNFRSDPVDRLRC